MNKNECDGSVGGSKRYECTKPATEGKIQYVLMIHISYPIFNGSSKRITYLKVIIPLLDMVCGEDNDHKCQTEFKNAKTNKNLKDFYTRCRTEGGANPMRKTCSLCCNQGNIWIVIAKNSASLSRNDLRIKQHITDILLNIFRFRIE